MEQEVHMFCAECGKKLPEGAKFCPVCGTRVEKRSAEAEGPMCTASSAIFTCNAPRSASE